MLRAASVLTLFAVSLVPNVARAEVRYVRAGDNLQAALNAARPGDELRLAPEATFSGNFVLPVTAGFLPITVRTDLPDDSLPSAKSRVTPATAARFAKIASPNTAAALRTAPGAHHWRLMFLEFPATREGYGDIVQIGDGSADQNQAAQVPYEIVLDRVYIHGDRVYGQKRGVALNGRIVTIRNSYISDIKAVGIDAQAIAGWNGPGPFSIENNYLEASGNAVLFGGADPAIPNLVVEDVSVRFNHMSRPLTWRDPIVASPSNVTANATGGGSLSAGIYTYRVVARRAVGQGSTAASAPSDEITAVPTSGAVAVGWEPVADATQYDVYARNPAGVTQVWTVQGTQFLHNGGAQGRTATPPAAGTRWGVKNIFELKNARRVRVEYNLLENNWQSAQQGYSVLFTPRNQDGKCPWCVVEQVEFSHNIVRNVAGGISITGFDTNAASAQTNGIRIRDNLMYEITTQLGGPGWGFLIGEGPRDLWIDHNTIDFDGTTLLFVYGGTSAAPKPIGGFRFTNNAAPHRQYGVNGDNASTGTLTFQMYLRDAVFTGNWLSGGSSSRYPPGNRFEEPFDAKLTPAAPQSANAAGASIVRLLPLLDTVPKGFMAGVPQAPKVLTISLAGTQAVAASNAPASARRGPDRADALLTPLRQGTPRRTVR